MSGLGTENAGPDPGQPTDEALLEETDRMDDAELLDDVPDPKRRAARIVVMAVGIVLVLLLLLRLVSPLLLLLRDRPRPGDQAVALRTHFSVPR